MCPVEQVVRRQISGRRADPSHQASRSSRAGRCQYGRGCPLRRHVPGRQAGQRAVIQAHHAPPGRRQQPEHRQCQAQRRTQAQQRTRQRPQAGQIPPGTVQTRQRLARLGGNGRRPLARPGGHCHQLLSLQRLGFAFHGSGKIEHRPPVRGRTGEHIRCTAVHPAHGIVPFPQPQQSAGGTAGAQGVGHHGPARGFTHGIRAEPAPLCQAHARRLPIPGGGGHRPHRRPVLQGALLPYRTAGPGQMLFHRGQCLAHAGGGTHLYAFGHGGACPSRQPGASAQACRQGQQPGAQPQRRLFPLPGHLSLPPARFRRPPAHGWGNRHSACSR